MKKRLLSALLALALVFVLLPTTALASSIDPDITIAGTEYDFELENYKENTYKTVYYQHDKFLTKFEYTSDGVWATDPYLELTKTGAGNATTITITVHKGSNTTKAFEIKSAETCIATSSSYWNLVITGSGALSLTHTGTSAAIWSNHSNITITGGVTVNVKGTKSGSNINSYSNAIQCGETFTVSNGATVVAENNSTYSNGPAVKTEKFIISGDAKFEAKSAYGGKAISFDSITADGYDFMGRSGNSGSYTTLTGDDKATKLQEYSSIQITPTPTPALEKSNVYVAGTNLYKNTAYTIQNGKPVMGGTYPGNYNIYFDATDYVLHVKDAVIEATGNARGTTGIYGTSNIVFEGDNSITASTYGIYSYFTQSDLKISGTGSLNVKTIAAAPAIATDYNTSRSIIISGNHFTVTADTSETTSCAIKSDKDLKITDGAAVIAKSNATRAIDIKGNLTVTSGSLKATSNSDNVPTVQVGGNATFTGSTVTITNNSTTQGEQYKDSNAASSALHVDGAITISGGEVTAEAKAGGNAIRAVKDITVSDGAQVTATNNSQHFSAITAGKASDGVVNNLSKLIVSGEKTKITATNSYANSSTGAIHAYIKNANKGHYLKVEGTNTKTIAPNAEDNNTGRGSITITRGDEVTRTKSPVVIAGTTLLNNTYYTITNGSTVAEGTENNYNAFYDSASKTLKLNNAQISHSFANENSGGTDGAIIFKEFENYFIELSGENTISSTNTYAINCHRPDRTLTIKNAAEAENAKLTLTSNWMVICSIGGLNIQSDVTMVNTKRADYLMYVNGTFSYTGYNAYASTEASGSPLEVYNPQNYSTYKYLRVTKENLAPTTPTTYTVTITAGDNMKHESGALTQEVTKGAAITEVKFMAASGHYFPADYVSKMNLPAGLTAEIKENSWYLIISGTPTSDVTINLPAASVRPTITVSMPTPVAGNTPATANDITLTYSDINKSISKNLTISNVVWQSYVSNGDGSITPGNTLSSGDKFEAGKTYFVRITHEYVAGKYDIVPAAGITLDYTESDSTDMMLLFYTTGAPCNHEYTNDWHANGNTHWHECKLCRAHADEVAHTFGDWITDTPATDTTDGSKHRTCSVCQYKENATIPKTGTGEIVPPTPDNPGTIVIIRPAEEEKPAQQPNPSTGANDLVGLAVAAAVAAALGSAALLRKHD